MIYTLDLPTSSPAVNKRLGFRLPTSILLPPYLAVNPYFVEYTDSIDEVYASLLTARLEAFGNIRQMWVTSAEVEAKIAEQSMIDFSDWTSPERTLLVKQVNLLGMKISNSGIITDSAYLALSRFVGQYWLEKGKYAAINFLNFCLDQEFTLVKLWTADYQTFVPEGDIRIGTPVWAGGQWFPTTHVSLVVSGALGTDPQLLTSFFDDVANYNLVLQAIDQVFDMKVVGTATSVDADIVAIALLCDNRFVISNVSSYGASAPPTTEDIDWVSVKFYAIRNARVTYFLGKPSGWINTSDGKKLPVYGKPYQSPSVAHSLPTSCYGSGNTLLGTTLCWVNVPGSPNSHAKIPAYIDVGNIDIADPAVGRLMGYPVVVSLTEDGSADAKTVIATASSDAPVTVLPFLQEVAFASGAHPRTYYGVAPIPLTSPLGFHEVYPRVFVPYW